MLTLDIYNHFSGEMIDYKKAFTSMRKEFTKRINSILDPENKVRLLFTEIKKEEIRRNEILEEIKSLSDEKLIKDNRLLWLDLYNDYEFKHRAYLHSLDDEVLSLKSIVKNFDSIYEEIFEDRNSLELCNDDKIEYQSNGFQQLEYGKLIDGILTWEKTQVQLAHAFNLIINKFEKNKPAEFILFVAKSEKIRIHGKFPAVQKRLEEVQRKEYSIEPEHYITEASDLIFQLLMKN